MPAQDATYVRLSEGERQFVDAVAESSLRSRNAVIRTLIQWAMTMPEKELANLFGAGVRSGQQGGKEEE